MGTASNGFASNAVGGQSRGRGHGVPESDALAPPRRPWDLARDLDIAFQLLGSARLGGPLDLAAVGTPIPIMGLSPLALYMDGLDRLEAVRQEWYANRDAWEREYERYVLQYSYDQTLAQAIESALAYYAPWGIDLTRFLLHTGTIGAFDMRVLGPYGELLYADANLSTCHKNEAIGLNIQQLAERGTTVHCYLRLYGRAAMQQTIWD